MKYERLTEKDIDICTWDSPKPKVKIKPMPFLIIDGNVYSPQEQANIRLKYLEDLIEQGKLIELPCKVGDIVYQIHGDFNKMWFLVECVIDCIAITADGFEILDEDGLELEIDTIYLTKAQAEARLKELRGER